jgi:hypothetical protein
LAPSSSAPIAETSTISLVRTSSRNFCSPLPTRRDVCATFQRIVPLPR